MMELEQVPAASASATGVPVERARLPVLGATEDEIAEHAKVLQEIQAESKGKCLWLKLDGETPGAG
jgi:DNA polymerase III subunit epsilon